MAEVPSLIDPPKMYDRDIAVFNNDAKRKAAEMENLKDVVSGDDVDVALVMRNGLEVKNLDDAEVKCKVCSLSFKSQQDLHDHNEAFQYCCWQCFICYETLQEAQNHTC